MKGIPRIVLKALENSVPYKTHIEKARKIDIKFVENYYAF